MGDRLEHVKVKAEGIGITPVARTHDDEGVLLLRAETARQRNEKHKKVLHCKCDWGTSHFDDGIECRQRRYAVCEVGTSLGPAELSLSSFVGKRCNADFDGTSWMVLSLYSNGGWLL